MQPITLRQIAELPDREKRQFQAATNHFLGEQYAAMKRRKRISAERTKLELGESEDEL